MIAECAAVSRAGAFSSRHGGRVAQSDRVGRVGAKHANNALFRIIGVGGALVDAAASFAVLWGAYGVGGQGDG